MRKSYALLSASILLSMSVVSGCVQNPSTDSSSPTASVTPSKPATVASNSEANKVRQAIATAKPTHKPAGVKTIKSEPALKAGKKLTPQEVEDLIRKLSVCRPT